MYTYVRNCIFIGLGSVIVMLSLAGCTELREYKKQVEAITIEDVDPEKVADGDYTGKHETKLVSAEVEVAVRNGHIEEITLTKHEHGRGEKAESIVDSVVEEQSLEVDTVSGATGSSKIILKAIEKALRKGLPQN